MTKRMIESLFFILVCVTAPRATAQCELTRLESTGGAQADELGAGVSISNGVAAVAGGGEVVVFTGSGAHWTESARLAPADGAYLASAALVGSILITGAPNGDGIAVNTGSAYVFERGPTGWVETAKLVASDGAWDDAFGTTIALHGDRAVVGAWIDGAYLGAAYVYDRGPSGWVETGKLVASDGESGDMFGLSVGVFGDDVVVGAHREDDQGGDAGAVYVFALSPTGWVERHKLTPTDATVGAWFGFSVAMAENAILVGAPQGAGATPLSGTAYLFERGLHGWTQTVELAVPGTTDGSQTGHAVALAPGRAVVGAYAQTVDQVASGAAHVFERDTTTWHAASDLAPMEAADDDRCGFAVALDGDHVLVGAPGSDTSGPDAGAAYVFDLAFEGGVSVFCIAAPNSTGTAARIDHLGTVRISRADFTLVATGCPPLQPGVFYYGASEAQVPFGNGFRCVGGPFFRLPITGTSSQGSAEHLVDYAAPPTAAGRITPGSTWHFQFWFRDPAAGGAAFNLTDGLRATFCP